MSHAGQKRRTGDYDYDYDDNDENDDDDKDEEESQDENDSEDDADTDTDTDTSDASDDTSRKPPSRPVPFGKRTHQPALTIPLSDLPDDTLMEIIKHADEPTKVALSAVTKNIHQLINPRENLMFRVHNPEQLSQLYHVMEMNRSAYMHGTERDTKQFGSIEGSFIPIEKLHIATDDLVVGDFGGMTIFLSSGYDWDDDFVDEGENFKSTQLPVAVYSMFNLNAMRRLKHLHISSELIRIQQSYHSSPDTKQALPLLEILELDVNYHERKNIAGVVYLPHDNVHTLILHLDGLDNKIYEIINRGKYEVSYPHIKTLILRKAQIDPKNVNESYLDRVTYNPYNYGDGCFVQVDMERIFELYPNVETIQLHDIKMVNKKWSSTPPTPAPTTLRSVYINAGKQTTISEAYYHFAIYYAASMLSRDETPETAPAKYTLTHVHAFASEMAKHVTVYMPPGTMLEPGVLAHVGDAVNKTVFDRKVY